MNIETKFNLGDTVYRINPHKKETWVDCEYCVGKGEVTLTESGMRLSCPKCYGRRGRFDYEPVVKWHVLPEYGVIGKVGVEAFWPKSQRENEETYMLDITGVGSGTVYKAINLFATVEEAQAECDRRNTEQ